MPLGKPKPENLLAVSEGGCNRELKSEENAFHSKRQPLSVPSQESIIQKWILRLLLGDF